MAVTYTVMSGVALKLNELVSGPSATYCDFGVGSPFSAETWFKTSETAEEHFLTTGTTNTVGWELGINGGSAGRTHFYIANNVGRDSLTSAGVVTAFNNNQWHHSIGIRDSANGSMWLYTDGSLVGSMAMTAFGSGLINPGIGLRLGKRSSGGTDFVGSLDEVRVSNTARYTGTATIAGFGSIEYTNDSNTNLLWHFNEGTGSVTVDASSTAANGILSANAAWIDGVVVSGNSGAALTTIMQGYHFWGPI